MTTSNFSKKALILVAFSFVFAACKKKDDPVVTPSTYDNNTVQWKLFNEGGGLSNNEIKAIAEDAYGKVWVATVSEYNEPMAGGNGWWILPTTTLHQVKKQGNISTVLDSNNNDYFKGRISALHFGAGDEMHMGMANGPFSSLVRRENHSYIKYQIPSSSHSGFFSFLKNDEGLWFGKMYEGLYLFDHTGSGSFVKYDNSNSDLPQNGTQYDLVPSVGDDFYINSFQGILLKSGGSINTIYDNTSTEGMDLDSQGNRWAIGLNNSPFGYALIKITDTDTTRMITPINYSAGIVSSLVIDSHDNIWIATKGPGQQGLFKFNGQTWTNYTTSNSPLHSQELTKLFVDSEGNLWIGSSDAGLIVLNEFGTRN